MKRIGIMLFVLAFPLTAFSQWYVGVTAGVYELDEPGLDWEKAGIYSPRVGYRFNKIFALEGSYVFFGEAELENSRYYGTIEGGLFDIGLVGTIPVTEKFEIFARVGYGYWAANINDYGYNNDDTGDSWNYGGGLAFNFNKNWSLFAGYQRYEFNLDYYGDLSADTVYAGGKFYFDFDKSSSKSSKSSAVVYEPQPTPSGSPQLRAVTDAERNSCKFLETVTTGSGGPDDPSIHTENAMKKALVSAANAGADSYYIVNSETTGTGASVILEALKCN